MNVRMNTVKTRPSRTHFPFQWVPESPWCDLAGRVVALVVDPTHLQLDFSVQQELNGCRGIIRGQKVAGRLVEDHVDQVLTQEGQLADSPTLLVGPERVRRDVWAVSDHVRTYQEREHTRRIVSWSGNGNLLANPSHIGLVRDEDRLVLYRVASEEDVLRNGGPTYTFSVRWARGCDCPVSIRQLRLEDIDWEQPHPIVKTVVDTRSGKDVTESIVCATSGPPLVRDGIPLNRQELVNLCVEGQFYDLRHVFLFGRLSCGDRRWIDVGLSAFWDDKGARLERPLRLALSDPPRPISIDLDTYVGEGSPLGPHLDSAVRRIDDAMKAKGYRRCLEWQERGEYELDSMRRRLTVTLRDGIYPQHIIGVKEGGEEIIEVFVTGLSNRVGMTILDAARTAAQLGLADAILLDAGDDVVLNIGDKRVVGSAQSQRDRFRSLLLWTADKSLPREKEGVEVIAYPPQRGASEG